MILTKMVINSVAGKLAKHFKLDKIMSYVFDKNELDDKVENLEKDVELLKSLAKSSKEFKCNYKKNKKKEIKHG